MYFADISIWGVLLVAALVVACLALLYVADRLMLSRVVKAIVVGVAQIALTGLYMKWLYAADSWVLHLLWFVAMVAVMSFTTVRQSHLHDNRLLLPVGGALLGGTVVSCLCLAACFSTIPLRYLFVPAMAVSLSGMFVSVKGALTVYSRSLKHTTDHRYYLLANGASHLESLLPSMRRALRAAVMPHIKTLASPLFMAMPMLMCGMLLVGASPVFAAVTTLIVTAVSMVASVLSAVLLFWLSDHFIAQEEKP